MKKMEIHHTGIIFRPNSRRVLVRPFLSSDDERVGNILSRAMALSEVEVEAELAELRDLFARRHLDLEACWRRHFGLVERRLNANVSLARQLYIGALFSGEYALESAALFNPSMVPHPNQSGLNLGDLRFVLSLRATGEGHVSSIEFRSGVLEAKGGIRIDETSDLVVAPEMVQNPTYWKSIFVHKLDEMGFGNRWSERLMGNLGDRFTRDDLDLALATIEEDDGNHEIKRTRECVKWLAESNYQIHFHPSVPLCERVIFPVSPNESNGVEDARFVKFCDDDGSTCYYATYTAYNGRAILPQLIETTDFLNFRVLTLNGRAVQNKGMALFPRRVGGRFAMVSRQDDENLHLMYSENLHFWNDPQILHRPSQPWEMVKIGNCGSPIETAEGWLVVTHGVGPMRRYCIGAVLLDLDDPSRVIGSLRRPLLEPQDEGREGYVPNVVYSCGALIHQGRLILPYALSDTSTTIATIDIEDLVNRLKDG